MSVAEFAFTVNDYLSLDLTVKVAEAAIKERIPPTECKGLSEYPLAKQLKQIENMGKKKDKRQVSPEDRDRADTVAYEFALEYIYSYSPKPGRNVYYALQYKTCKEVAIINLAPDKVDAVLAVAIKNSEISEDYYAARDEYLELIDYAGAKKDNVLHMKDGVFLSRGLELLERKKQNILLSPPIGISNSTQEITLCYVDLSKITQGPTPTWDEVFSRVSHPDHMRAFFYSVVNAKHNGRQVVCLAGGANTGKSAMANAISSVLGDRVCGVIAANRVRDKNIGYDLLGKRFIFCPDNKDPTILSTEFVHNITGGDVVTIEQKYKDSLYAKLQGVLLICSNDPVKIDYTDNELTRLIPLKIASRDGPDRDGKDPEWEKSLRDEVYHMLYQGRIAYSRLVKRSHMSVSEIDFAENYDSSYYEFNKILLPYTHSPGNKIEYAELHFEVKKIFQREKQVRNMRRIEELFAKYLKHKFGSDLYVDRSDPDKGDVRYYTNLELKTKANIRAAHEIMEKDLENLL